MAVEAVERKFWARDVAAVHERDFAADAANAAPGAHADYRAEFVVLEEVGEEVAIRGRVFVGDAGHRAVENDLRLGGAGGIAGGVHAGEDAAEALEDDLIDEAAAVVAHVEDKALLADLREKLLDEFVEAGGFHVGEIDVADFAAGGLLDFFAIGVDPIEFAEAEFGGDGPDDDVARAFARRAWN